MRNQKGFSLVLVAAVVAVIAVVGLVGYRVMEFNKTASETATTTKPAAQNQTATESVDATIKEVDAVTVDDSALSDIDAQLNY